MFSVRACWETATKNSYESAVKMTMMMMMISQFPATLYLNFSYHLMMVIITNG